jgi:hypothetical protein
MLKNDRKLLNYCEECKELLSDVSQTLEHLEKLQEQYHFVSNKTKALHTSCEALLQQQVAYYLINHIFNY